MLTATASSSTASTSSSSSSSLPLSSSAASSKNLTPAPNEAKLLEYIALEELLDKEIKEHECEIETRSIVSQKDYSSFTEDELIEAIELLRLKLEEVSMAASVKKRVVQSVNESFVSVKTLYNNEGQANRELDVKDALAQRDTLVSQILLRLADFEKIKKELTTLQLENKKLRTKLAPPSSETPTSNKQEVEQSDEYKQNQQTISKLDKSIREQYSKSFVLAQVLLGLILESGVEWTKDPKLMETVMGISEMGDDINGIDTLKKLFV